MPTWTVRKDVSKSTKNLSVPRAQCNSGKVEHRAKVCAAAPSAQAEAESTEVATGAVCVVGSSLLATKRVSRLVDQ